MGSVEENANVIYNIQTGIKQILHTELRLFSSVAIAVFPGAISGDLKERISREKKIWFNARLIRSESHAHK